MGTEKKRLQILDELKNTFLKFGTEHSIFRSVLNSQICLRHGVTKNKADEYIQVLLEYFILREKLQRPLYIHK